MRHSRFATGLACLVLPAMGLLATASAAGAATTSTTAQAAATAPPSFPSNLWVPAAVAMGLALIVVALTWVVTGCSIATLNRAIPDTKAWDSKDSWLTNITAVGSVLTAVFTQSAVTHYLVTGTDQNGFVVMSVLLGGAAALGPLAFAAFAKRPADAAGEIAPAGTRAGLLVGNVVTLFSTFGLLALAGLMASDTTATSTEKALVYVGLSLGAVVVVIYALRSAIIMIKHAHTTATLASPKAVRSGTL
jgi:hypothetical protein